MAGLGSAGLCGTLVLASSRGEYGGVVGAGAPLPLGKMWWGRGIREERDAGWAAAPGSLPAPGQAVLFLTVPMSHLPGLSRGRQGRPGLWEAPGRSSSLMQWQDLLITHPGFPPRRAQGSAQAPLSGMVAWILGGGEMGWGEWEEESETRSWLGGICQAPSVLRRVGRRVT